MKPIYRLMPILAMTVLVACTSIGTKKEATSELVADPNSQVEAFFERVFDERLARSPRFQTYLGMKTNYDKWDDLSEEFEKEGLELTKSHLESLKGLDRNSMAPSNQLSYDLMKQSLEEEIEDYHWRYYNYPINQMFGVHAEAPSLLINQHRIATVKDAEAYIGRLTRIPELFRQLITRLNIQAGIGIIPPKFVFPLVIESSRNIITGAPFSDSEDSTLLADFRSKVMALKIDSSDKDALISRASKALSSSVKPAYEELIASLQDLEKRADSRDGVWKFPEGEAYYNNALKRTTTTDMTADEIHNVGLMEVERIHAEMRVIMEKVNYNGTLQEFFVYMRNDDRFYYSESEEGKQIYLNEATAIIDNMKARLDELFLTKPKADLVVKRVEAFREKSAGKAFYQQPSLDGSRPGLYYANLYKMKEMPIYQMEALAYHEGVPGHHMQISIAQELKSLPKFRKFGRYTAYIEGWGLYSEYIPKEMGLYQDPYSDFGRLAMELWRACRLVVDTGIHAKRWTREQAIRYLVENTPNPENDSMKAIERYIVMPSQATAYKVGMMKILELREISRKKLGNKFDIRKFHDVILRNGAVPLNVLENLVEDWVKKTNQS